MFPFVIEVDGFALAEHRLYDNNTLIIDIFVSPHHYCELVDDKANDIINRYMHAHSAKLLKSVLPSWDGSNVRFRCFPEINKYTIFDGLDLEDM